MGHGDGERSRRRGKGGRADIAVDEGDKAVVNEEEEDKEREEDEV